MDSRRIIERIENGELKFEDNIGGAVVHIHLDAADKLGVLLKQVRLESSHVPKDVPATLRKQSAAVIAGLGFIEALKVIEIDALSHAVQLRSERPSAEGFSEIILRRGAFISFERRGAPLHISKPHFERLLQDLTSSL